MSDKEQDYSWIAYLPDNYTNSGRLFGLVNEQLAKELLIILGSVYLLTAVFLANSVTPSVLWGVRVGILVFVTAINFMVKMYFKTTMINFIQSVIGYQKLNKKYRYKRRDAAYAKHIQQKEKSRK